MIRPRAAQINGVALVVESDEAFNPVDVGVLGSGREGGGGGETDGSAGSAMAYIHKLVCEFVKLTLAPVVP